MTTANRLIHFCTALVLLSFFAPVAPGATRDISRGTHFLFVPSPESREHGPVYGTIHLSCSDPAGTTSVQVTLLTESGDTVLFDGPIAGGLVLPLPPESHPQSRMFGALGRRAVEIVAADPIEVVNYGWFDSYIPVHDPHFEEDGSRVLPVASLGRHVVALGVPNESGTSAGNNGRSGFLFWAVEDGTIVRFTPACDAYIGSGTAGQPMEISLRRGESYRYACDAGDISGTVLNGNLPFGAWTFNNVGLDWYNPPDPRWAVSNKAYEALYPEDPSATDFLIPPVPQPTTYLIRIAPISKPAHVRVLDDFAETLVDLVPGEFYQYVLLDFSHSVRVLSDAPVSVLKCSNADGANSSDTLVGQYQMVVPRALFAREHRLRRYDAYLHNYVTLIAPPGRLREIRMNGTPLTAATFRRRVVYPPDFTIEGAVLEIRNPGEYTFSADFPFGLYFDGTRETARGGFSLTGSMERSVLPATVRIEPETLMLGRRGMLTAFMDLPDGVTRDDLEPESFRLEREIPGTLQAITGKGTCVVKFPARELLGRIDPGESVPLTVSVSLKDDLSVEGSDRLRVLAPAAGLLRNPVRPKP